MLTTEAVVGMLEQLLPVDQRKALDEYGAIEHELPAAATSSDRFTVVAARGGDDVWLEIRRTPAPIVVADPAEAPPVLDQVPQQAEAVKHARVEPAAVEPVKVEPPGIEQPVEEQPASLAQPAEVEPSPRVHVEPEVIAAGSQVAPQAEAVSSGAVADEESAPFEIVEDEPQIVPTHAEVDALLTASAASLASAAAEPAAAPAPSSVPEPVAETARVEEPAPVERAEPAMAQAPQAAPGAEPLPRPKIVEETRQAVVLPLSRSPITAEPILEVRTAAGTPLERVLKIAAARGAATVYVVARSQPVIRVDGEISVLDGEPSLTAAEVERLVMDLAPARVRDEAPAGEWMADVPDVGRVRCVTFRDHRGPGVIFRMIPPKAISADQLGIPPEVQALCAQPDGLVVVTGARASGKSTLLSAFVDLINRTRSDHVITIESQIGFVHESRRSFVSQREVRGHSETATNAVRSAFREDPDVLVIEDIRTPEIVSVAFEAAESGRLVFASVSAPSTIAALDRLIEVFPPDRRAQAQTSLAGALRGVVAQTLLRKVRGGRIAAREILLNTPAVAALILEGKTFQLPVALDSGRRHGMMPLVDALASLVREGTVHASEAYRKATDRDALLAALRRDGVDTSFAERLA
jgi:twitching motility protein PilT